MVIGISFTTLWLLLSPWQHYVVIVWLLLSSWQLWLLLSSRQQYMVIVVPLTTLWLLLYGYCCSLDNTGYCPIDNDVWLSVSPWQYYGYCCPLDNTIWLSLSSWHYMVIVSPFTTLWLLLFPWQHYGYCCSLDNTMVIVVLLITLCSYCYPLEKKHWLLLSLWQ